MAIEELMGNLLFSCNVVVPIFVLIMLGYALTRLKLWDGNFLKIANYILEAPLKWNEKKRNIFELVHLVFVCLG